MSEQLTTTAASGAVATIHRHGDFATDALAVIEKCLTPVASPKAECQLEMRGWSSEWAYERVLRLFQGDGIRDLMPPNDENTFFVIYTPAQLYFALALRAASKEDYHRARHTPFGLHRELTRMLESLGPEVVDQENQADLDRVLHFLAGSVLQGADTAILFTDLP